MRVGGGLSLGLCEGCGQGCARVARGWGVGGQGCRRVGEQAEIIYVIYRLRGRLKRHLTQLNITLSSERRYKRLELCFDVNKTKLSLTLPSTLLRHRDSLPCLRGPPRCEATPRSAHEGKGGTTDRRGTCVYPRGGLKTPSFLPRRRMRCPAHRR